MADLSGYDANEYEPSVPSEVTRAGDYPAIITTSEWRDTKNGDGQYLYLELQVAEGEYQGRKLFERLNLKNQNEQAVEIAKRTLSAICRAVGNMTPTDSEDLHNIPILVKVDVEKRGENGE